MPQTLATQYNTRFKKITFELLANGIPFYIQTLTIGPEELTREDTIDATVTRTLGSAHVDDFGMGLITYNLNGTTGFHSKTNAEGKTVDGYIEIKDLRDRIIRYIEEPGGTPREKQDTTEYSLIFHDWAMEEHFYVQPIGRFRLVRSKSRPLLHAYDFSFVALRPTTFYPKDSAYGSDSTWEDVQNTMKRLYDAYMTSLKATDLLRILLNTIL